MHPFYYLKCVLLSIAFFLFSSSFIYSQNNTCSGNVTLSTQAEVDAFQCGVFEGNLTISGEDITNLDGLSELQTITGNLLIRNNPNLISIELLAVRQM